MRFSVNVLLLNMFVLSCQKLVKEKNVRSNILTWRGNIPDFLIQNQMYIFKNVVDRDKLSLYVLKDIVTWLQPGDNDNRFLVINGLNLHARNNLLNVFEKAYRFFFNNNVHRVRSITTQTTMQDIEKIGFKINVIRNQKHYSDDLYMLDMFDRLVQNHSLIIFYDAKPGNRYINILKFYSRFFAKLKILISSSSNGWDTFTYKMVSYEQYEDLDNSQEKEYKQFLRDMTAPQEDPILYPLPDNIEEYILQYIPDAKRRKLLSH